MKAFRTSLTTLAIAGAFFLGHLYGRMGGPHISGVRVAPPVNWRSPYLLDFSDGDWFVFNNELAVRTRNFNPAGKVLGKVSIEVQGQSIVVRGDGPARIAAK